MINTQNQPVVFFEGVFTGSTRFLDQFIKVLWDNGHNAPVSFKASAYDIEEQNPGGLQRDSKKRAEPLDRAKVANNLFPSAFLFCTACRNLLIEKIAPAITNRKMVLIEGWFLSILVECVYLFPPNQRKKEVRDFIINEMNIVTSILSESLQVPVKHFMFVGPSCYGMDGNNELLINASKAYNHALCDLRSNFRMKNEIVTFKMTDDYGEHATVEDLASNFYNEFFRDKSKNLF